jgi:hypothetical protein
MTPVRGQSTSSTNVSGDMRITLDLEARERFCAYFSRIEVVKEASLIIPSEKIPCSLDGLLDAFVILREMGLLPIMDGVTILMVSKAASSFSSSFKHARRNVFTSRSIRTLANTSTEWSAEDAEEYDGVTTVESEDCCCD